MTVYHPETNKVLKHYAFDSKTNGRYIVIALENETDPNTCSVVDLDMLDSEMAAEFIEYINSDACQHSYEVWKELDKKMFSNYPRNTMLSVLRSMRKIKVLPSEQVMVQCPNEQNHSAKEIMADIKEFMKSKNVTKFNPVATESTPVNSEGENKNAEEIKELKEQVQVLTNSLTSLVELIKSEKKKK